MSVYPEKEQNRSDQTPSVTETTTVSPFQPFILFYGLTFYIVKIQQKKIFSWLYCLLPLKGSSLYSVWGLAAELTCSEDYSDRLVPVVVQ